MAYCNGDDGYGPYEGLGQLPRVWTGPGGGGGPAAFLPGAKRFGLPGGGTVPTSEAAPIPYLPQNGKPIAGPQPEPKQRPLEPPIVADPLPELPPPDPVVSTNGSVPAPVEPVPGGGYIVAQPSFAVPGGGGGGPVTVTVEPTTPLDGAGARPGFGIVEAAIAAGLAAILAAAWARREKK